jgi:hypothetical protein
MTENNEEDTARSTAVLPPSESLSVNLRIKHRQTFADAYN